MPTEKNQIRIDLVSVGDTKIIDEEKRRFQGTLIPDPERYTWETIEGKKYLIDKFDNLAIPEDEFTEMFENAKEMPIYASEPKIPDINKYGKKRIKPIKDFLINKSQKYSPVDKSEEFLTSLKKDEMKFVILTVDLKGSPILSQSLEKHENAKIISLFIREMSSIVNNYRGYVLKYVGDGLIAYFPEPNFIGMNDNAVDCGFAMIMILRNTINKILIKQGLPKLKLRIGIDSGEAIIVDMGNESVKMHKDLISETVNLSSKIQSLAPENGMVIGDSTARNLHVSRRTFFDKSIPDGWKYTTKNGEIYPVHVLKFKQYAQNQNNII